MDAQQKEVEIQSVGYGNAIEWIESFKSNTLRGARSKATRFIHHQGFNCKINRAMMPSGKEIWQLVGEQQK